MKFFIDVHYCDYSKWNFFGLLNRKTERRPMEIAIISEDGDCFTAFFSSVMFHWRIMDESSKALDLLVRSSGIDDNYDCYDSDEVVVTAARNFIELHAGPDAIVEFILAEKEKISFIDMDDAVDQIILCKARRITTSIYDLLTEFVDKMKDSDFGVDGPFEVVLFRADEQSYFTSLQKMNMFISHPEYPVYSAKSTLGKTKYAQQVYSVIKKVKKEMCNGK